MTIWHMRIAYWISKATDTHSQYGILFALSLQRWFQESAWTVLYTYIACLASSVSSEVPPPVLLHYIAANSLELNLDRTNNIHVKVTCKSIIYKCLILNVSGRLHLIKFYIYIYIYINWEHEIFNIAPCLLPHLLYNPTHALFTL